MKHGYAPMPQADPDQKTVIRRFARDVLGCGCPDEVFDRIEIGKGASASTWKIIVGDRLLIYLVRTNDLAFVKRSLAGVITSGKDERDRRGLNRFRLVLGTADCAAIEEAARRVYANVNDLDEKVHLHVVRPDAIPAL